MFYLLPMCATFIPFSSTDEVLFASVCLCVGRITPLIFFFFAGVGCVTSNRISVVLRVRMWIQEFLWEISTVVDMAILRLFPDDSRSCRRSLVKFSRVVEQTDFGFAIWTRHFNGIFATEGIFWDQLPGGTLFLSPNGSTWTFFQQLLHGVSFKQIKKFNQNTFFIERHIYKHSSDVRKYTKFLLPWKIAK